MYYHVIESNELTVLGAAHKFYAQMGGQDAPDNGNGCYRLLYYLSITNALCSFYTFTSFTE